ncbi:hypothetical protein [Nonomuraea typhae]|uniref:LPXTG cell wall anchor domain-containing protein n=1 Tax=Nonomuraea typhae TaxID=2603600 RepID=A0ABW7Z5X1_9ACTN
MRVIIATAIGLAVAVPAVGAAAAHADDGLAIWPSKVRAGGWLTVRLRCDPDAETGRIDGPASFGEIPIDGFAGGRWEDDVRVPADTPRGRQPVYGYCDDEPSGEDVFLVVGGRPRGGAHTGYGGAAMPAGGADATVREPTTGEGSLAWLPGAAGLSLAVVGAAIWTRRDTWTRRHPWGRRGTLTGHDALVEAGRSGRWPWRRSGGNG